MCLWLIMIDVTLECDIRPGDGTLVIVLLLLYDHRSRMHVIPEAGRGDETGNRDEGP